MFEKIQYWLLTDPKAKVKILFFIGSFVLVSGLLYGAILINTRPAQRVATSTSSSSQSQSSQIISFAQGGGIELVDNQNVFGEYGVFFDGDNNPIFVDEVGNLRYKQRTFTELGEVAPLSVYPADKNLIINGPEGVKLFLTDSNQVIQLPSNIVSIYPTQQNGNQVYYSLAKTDTGIDLQVGNDVGAIYNSQVLASFTSNKAFLELKQLAGKWYIFAYDDYYVKGTVEIFSFDQQRGQISKIYTLPRSFSLLYGSESILLNQRVGNQGEVILTVIDFGSQEQGQRYLVNVEKSLQENNLLGKVIPQRCQFGQEVNSLLCLVKVLDVDSTNPTVEDKMVRINYRSGSISFEYDNILIGATRLFVDKNFKVYVVSTSDNKLYKFVD